MSILHPGQLVKFATFAMSDEQSGWGIDEAKHILHTRDGGHTWKNVTPYYGTIDMYINTRFSPSGFFALDGDTAWATTPSLKPCADENCTPIPNIALLWHTTDGGNTWQGHYLCLQGEACGFPLIVAEDHFPMSIQFLDVQTGWMLFILGNGSEIRYRLYQTTDGGNHWLPVMDRSNLDPQDDQLQRNVIGLGFQDAHTAWMSIAESKRDGTSIPLAEWKIYRSVDGGITWDKTSLPAPEVSPNSFIPNPAQCYTFNMGVSPPASIDITFYCYTGSSYYFHYHSDDGGNHWVTWQETGSSQFLDAFLGWRLTAHDDLYDLEQTRDGGITWIKIKTVQWNGPLNFINEREGWVLARSINDIALVHTTNGGKGWDEIKPLMAEK